MEVLLRTRPPLRTGRLRDGGFFVAALGLFLATTAFECPGPEPSAGATGGGGATSSSSSGGAGGVGGVGGTGSSSTGNPCGADLANDPMHCGDCLRPCSPIGTAVVSCHQGRCDSPCIPGLVNVSQPDASVPDDGCESMVHRTFVTSAPVSGDMNGTLGGAHAGDDVCNATALAAGLTSLGTWRAWLSDTSMTSPSTRFTHDFGPYVLMDGTPIAIDWGDLTDGSIGHPIDEDELGMPMPVTGVDVWTSTNPMGTLTSVLNPLNSQPITSCLDWSTSNSDIDFGGIGNTAEVGPLWTDNPSPGPCYSTNMHLYCSEQ